MTTQYDSKQVCETEQIDENDHPTLSGCFSSNHLSYAGMIHLAEQSYALCHEQAMMQRCIDRKVEELISSVASIGNKRT